MVRQAQKSWLGFGRGCAMMFCFAATGSRVVMSEWERRLPGVNCDSLSIAVIELRKATWKRSVPGLPDRIFSGRRGVPVTSQTRCMGPSGATARDGGASHERRELRISPPVFQFSRAQFGVCVCGLDDRPFLNGCPGCRGLAGEWPDERRSSACSWHRPSLERGVVRAAFDRFGSGTIAHDR